MTKTQDNNEAINEKLYYIPVQFVKILTLPSPYGWWIMDRGKNNQHNSPTLNESFIMNGQHFCIKRFHNKRLRFSFIVNSYNVENLYGTA